MECSCYGAGSFTEDWSRSWMELNVSLGWMVEMELECGSYRGMELVVHAMKILESFNRDG